MADSTFWNTLADDFTRLAPVGGLRLNWQYTSGSPGHYNFTLASGDLNHQETFRLNFERLARREGAAVNESGDQDSLQVWLHELRNHARDPRNQGEPFGPEVLADGTHVFYQLGRIPNVCEAAANRCIELEMLEIEAERRR